MSTQVNGVYGKQKIGINEGGFQQRCDILFLPSSSTQIQKTTTISVTSIVCVVWRAARKGKS